MGRWWTLSSLTRIANDNSSFIPSLTKDSLSHLQLGLGGLDGGDEQVAHLACRLVEEEAHALAA